MTMHNISKLKIITGHPNFSLADKSILHSWLVTAVINYTEIIKTTISYNSHKETYMQVCNKLKTPITQPKWHSHNKATEQKNTLPSGTATFHMVTSFVDKVACKYNTLLAITAQVLIKCLTNGVELSKKKSNWSDIINKLCNDNTPCNF